MKKIIATFFMAFLAALMLQAQPSLLNGNFESWVNDSTPTPWVGSISVNLGIPITHNTINRTTDAHTGSAVKITSRALPLVGTAATGFLAYGTLGFDIMTLSPTFKGGIPVNGRPTKLKGYYKYANNGTDTMQVQMYCYHAGDTIGHGEFSAHATVTSYTYFEFDITYDAGAPDPDTINVIAYSSAGNAPQINSMLYLDDLSLEGSSGIEELPLNGNLSVYPNPASDLISVDLVPGTNNHIRICDLSGRVIYEEVSDLGHIEICLSHFSEGLYILENNAGGNRNFIRFAVVR